MNIINKINKNGKLAEFLISVTQDDLELVISTAADAYYNTEKSVLSDADYDILVETLKIKYPKSKILQKIGAPIRGKKVELPYHMGSMDKVKSDQKTLNKWITSNPGPYVLSDKLDGISCLITIDNKSVQLYTRGNGALGQQISHLVKYIDFGVDIKKLIGNNLAIRGELVMTKTTFKKYESQYENSRNMIAGVVNSKPERINRNLAVDIKFVAYETIKPWLIASEQLDLIKSYGINVVHWQEVDDISVDILNKVLATRKSKSVYQIDGIICTDDNKHPRNKSGNPSYSFAFKGLSETADVKVIEVLWNASKDGVIVPKIHYTSAKLSGATLDHTAGFNAKFIVDNIIGPGAIITIIRSGDTIPHIIRVVKPAKSAELPTQYKFAWDKTKTNIVLKNPDSNRQVIVKRMTKFAKDTGIENISEATMEKIINEGYSTIIDFITLSVADLNNIRGFGNRLSTKIYNNIQSAMSDLDILTLMVASNKFGRGMGERKIKKILQIHPDIVDKYKPSKNTDWYNKIMNIDGFDVITTRAFLDALPSFIEFYDEFRTHVNVKPYVVKKTKSNGQFKDQTIVFTGFRNDEWINCIENDGGKMGSKVGKNTTLLVYKEGGESSNNYKNAKALGIKAITQAHFAKIYKC